MKQAHGCMCTEWVPPITTTHPQRKIWALMPDISWGLPHSLVDKNDTGIKKIITNPDGFVEPTYGPPHYSIVEF